MTYVVWGLLIVHLMLLEGLGAYASQGDGDLIFGQLYQAVACSIPLLVFRLPPVTRWISQQQKAGRQRRACLTVLPVGALFVLGFVFIWTSRSSRA